LQTSRTFVKVLNSPHMAQYWNKLITITLFLVLTSASTGIFAQTETYCYYDQDTTQLFLDLYKTSSDSAPLVIFIHGGGFVGGSRKHVVYTPFFERLNARGIDVVSIDYSKPLVGQKFHCDQPAANKIMAFDFAARDIRRATNWLLENDEKIGISTEQVWLCGTSAGGEALFYALFGKPQYDEDPLPATFSYRGCIAFAGASTSVENITSTTAIPALLIHGSCDPLVPIGSAMHHYCPEDYPGALLLHGSESIADRYDSLGKDYQFILYCGAKHSVSNQAMQDDFDAITAFIFAEGLIEQKRIVIGQNDNCHFPGSAACGDN
jgi:acetyl esterase/lipase